MRITGLFARIYLLALLLLVAVVGSLTVFLEVGVEGEDEEETIALARWIAEDLFEEQQPSRQAERVNDLARRLDIEVALFTAAGELITASEGATISPLNQAERVRLGSERTYLSSGNRVVVGFFEGRALIAYFVSADVSSLNLTINWLTVIAIAVVLALLSWPLARRFSRPLERLSEQVRLFGAGDLRIRSRSKRRDEIGDLARSFDSMADQIADLVDKERQLLASVSHEFRTPLQRLRLFLDVLEDRGVIDGDEVNAVHEDITELDQLVHDIMLAARLDRGQATGTDQALLNRERSDLAALVQTSCEKFRRLYADRVLNCRVEAGNTMALVDARLFGRAVTNLLHNAHKYSPASEPILVALETTSAHCSVVVLDRGVGVPLELREEIFEPFTRHSETVSGLGLGLALVRRIIELHGGTVSMVPREGGGSSFRVTLRGA